VITGPFKKFEKEAKSLLNTFRSKTGKKLIPNQESFLENKESPIVGKLEKFLQDNLGKSLEI